MWELVQSGVAAEAANWRYVADISPAGFINGGSICLAVALQYRLSKRSDRALAALDERNIPVDDGLRRGTVLPGRRWQALRKELEAAGVDPDSV